MSSNSSTIVELLQKTPVDREVRDSRGRKWTFLQLRRTYSPTDMDAFRWECECGHRDPVLAKNLVHDEFIVEDPTSQLDRHDCDVERVRTVMDE